MPAVRQDPYRVPLDLDLDPNLYANNYKYLDRTLTYYDTHLVYFKNPNPIQLVESGC